MCIGKASVWVLGRCLRSFSSIGGLAASAALAALCARLQMLTNSTQRHDEHASVCLTLTLQRVACDQMSHCQQFCCCWQAACIYYI